MRGAGLLIALLLLGEPAAFADDAGLNVQLGWSKSVPNAKVRPVNQTTVKSVSLGKLAIVLEKSRLADVADAARGGRIKHRGDAGESVYWLCYRLAGARQLFVTAHGEMGGPKHHVSGIIVKDGVSDEAACPDASAKLAPVKFDFGLGLDATYAEFLRRLGEPSARGGERAVWMFERKGPLAGSEQNWSENQSIEVEFRAGKAVLVAVNQVTSY